MDKKTRGQIEYYFYNYRKLKKEAEEITKNLAYAQLSPVLDKIGGGKGISNPTEQKGLLLAQNKTAAWVSIVEMVYITYKFDIEGRILESRYIVRERPQKACNRIGCGYSTYYYWLDKALNTAEQWAKEYGLLK